MKYILIGNFQCKHEKEYQSQNVLFSLQVNASSVCTVEKQYGTYNSRSTQSQWNFAPPGQNRKIPPKCRDKSGCPYCGPMYPREHQLTPTQGLQIQDTDYKPALENHLQPQGVHCPVLHEELVYLRR